MSGNYIEWNGQTDAGEYMQITFANALDLSQYNQLGFWRYSDTITAGGDYDLEFLDSDGTVIRSFNLPAITAATVWQFTELDISADIRTDIKYMRIVCDVADNDIIDYCNLIAYEYGNGSGPVEGMCEVLISTGAINKGDLVAGIPGRPGYCIQGADNSEHIKGKALNTVSAAGLEVIVQVTGDIYQRCTGTTVVAGDPMCASSATTADDDTTAGRRFGTWRETSAAASADLKASLGNFG